MSPKLRIAVVAVWSALASSLTTYFLTRRPTSRASPVAVAKVSFDPPPTCDVLDRFDGLMAGAVRERGRRQTVGEGDLGTLRVVAKTAENSFPDGMPIAIFPTHVPRSQVESILWNIRDRSGQSIIMKATPPTCLLPVAEFFRLGHRNLRSAIIETCQISSNRTDSNGQATIRELPPGDYLIYARPEGVPFSWLVQVTIVDGRNVLLELIPELATPN
jgi:hypothetical protein